MALPTAVLWGASFPLALGSVAAPDREPGAMVGGLCAANTAGAILGAVGAGLFLVAHLGTRNTQRVLIVLSAVSALVLLVSLYHGSSKRRSTVVLAALATLGIGAALARNVSAVPAVLVQYGRFAAFTPRWIGPTETVYVGEGLNGFVAVSRNAKGLYYHNAGKPQASSEPQDMRLQRMLGHITHLLTAAPRKVLVVGFGSGVTAGAIAIAPTVQNLTIVEIEPLVPATVSKYFGRHNDQVIDNPKVNVRIDDGWHFLNIARVRFDAITVDPFDPWAKGSAYLQTRAFFEQAKNRLNPGGVLTLWLPLYENDKAAVKSAIATFFDAFPNGLVWGNTLGGEGYDLVLMGQAGPTVLDIDALQARIDRPGFEDVKRSLGKSGWARSWISSPVSLDRRSSWRPG